MLREVEMLTYDAWANGRVCDAVMRGPRDDARIAHLLAHIMASKEIWLGRMHGKEMVTIERFPAVAASEAVQRLDAVDLAWIEFASANQDFSVKVSYRDSRNNPYTQPLREVIAHVVNHSSYHRGQLATAIAQAGGEVPVTDFIIWTRVR